MSQARILVVEDDGGLREALVDTLLLGGYECREADSGEQALLMLSRQPFDMVISDIQMGGMDGLTLLQTIRQQHPQTPVLLMTAYANIDGAVRAMREGAIDYLAKPFSPEVLLNQVSRYVPAQRVEKRTVVCGDARSIELFALAARVARSDATVMISGPSGAGKEVLARYIHDQSSRAEQPFIAINCAAIPENMLEATLFGYEKGAFTGAVQGCPGKFEQAQGGTLLLDEITEMDLGLQAKLLRVLQEKEVERLGSRKMIPLDVRVLATSNRDLKRAVQEGTFREDLYYRLNVFPLRWSALCERPGDIVPLAEHLLALYAAEQGLPLPTIEPAAADLLLEYGWPGNVRELANVMQRALILCDGEWVREGDLILEEEEMGGETSLLRERQPGLERLGNELKQQEHQIILDTLNQCQGSRKAVAEKLGISPRTLRYKLAKMRDAGIELPA
ncbi:sigma-54 dependent transcriptional regulator [Aeromonas schubertii]|uniref:Sigma-54 dependent transcriptional regulator n=1 Tax=Aeromonas schubertii TaxID=652 RepID=A0ABS7VCD3_9GAMM|nr:sigma-54 dependent transcriptional regulator [Aeromonas schubertii]KUE80795.1 Fis family transcriptional regulator [Aeromonas schubertii]MBZ6066648.1 sigma-54 dependent transcriptional regulator [Aeromonas schubertii]MBZ6074260.1 sigma-54 dependent transcriptional regulator [Aeromonas schubertii]QCG47903.1 sigma-54-dependent Fis family transcriptional regulator [Aeromonas schubertii]